MTKRLFDILLSVTGLICLSPAFILIALAILFKFGNPIFFVQVRPGKDCVPFKLIKFRTMNFQTDENGSELSDHIRLTSFGRFIRASSLDEIPELWNVLKGDMSIVGPRPLLMEYLKLYSEQQQRRHNLRPGITGWAQVNGRNDISWKKKFELDLWYVDNRTMFLDFKIILMTIKKLFLAEGISKKGEATTSKFEGNKS